MTIAENVQLEQEMSIIRDPLDQTKQMTVNADGSISVSPATNSVQVVSGAAAVGAAPTVNPVGVSGIDGSGLTRTILVNASGATVADNSVMASDGVMLPIDSIAQTLGYTTGDLTTITVVYGGNTYVQTLTYTSGNITAISEWVKQ
jgi:hypothetical protein